MQNGQVDLNKFPGIPDFALEKLQSSFVAQPTGETGVSQFMGHDKGVAYRFFVHPEYNFIKSKAARYEVFDNVEMIQWHNDQYTQPTERVNRLPEELLSLDPDTGEILGGEYAEAYRNFKAGKAAPGTKLRHWGILTEAQVATLEAAKIFSVEQLAAKEEKTFKAKYGKEFGEVWDRAVQFTNGKEGRFEVDKQATEIVDLQKQNALLLARLAALEEKSAEPGAPKRRRPGKPQKVEQVEA